MVERQAMSAGQPMNTGQPGNRKQVLVCMGQPKKMFFHALQVSGLGNLCFQGRI